MFSTHRTQSITCGHCGYVQGVRLREVVRVPNVVATVLTAGAWGIGWALIARRNAQSNLKRCCAYCGEYLLAYTEEERAEAKARRDLEMAGELSLHNPTIATPTPEPERRTTPVPKSRRLPSQRV